MMPRLVRAARALAPVVPTAAACVLLLACGGGTDIAPSQPVVEGEGLATATLGGRDFGATRQIGSGVSSSVNVPTNVVDEPITFSGGYATLSRVPLNSARVVVTGTPGVPGSPVYCQGTDFNCEGVPLAPCGGAPCDYWLANQIGGVLQASLATRVSGTVYADYSYFERISSFDVGITFASGQYLAVAIFNLPTSETGPLTILDVSPSPPLAPYPLAFNAILDTDITTLGDRERYEALGNDPANTLTLTRVDISDPQNACLAGTMHVMVRAQSDPAAIPQPLDATFETPGC